MKCKKCRNKRWIKTLEGRIACDQCNRVQFQLTCEFHPLAQAPEHINKELLGAVVAQAMKQTYQIVGK